MQSNIIFNLVFNCTTICHQCIKINLFVQIFCVNIDALFLINLLRDQFFSLFNVVVFNLVRKKGKNKNNKKRKMIEIDKCTVWKIFHAQILIQSLTCCVFKGTFLDD